MYFFTREVKGVSSGDSELGFIVTKHLLSQRKESFESIRAIVPLLLVVSTTQTYFWIFQLPIKHVKNILQDLTSFLGAPQNVPEIQETVSR